MTVESWEDVAENSVGLIVSELSGEWGVREFQQAGRVLEEGRRLVVLVKDALNGKAKEMDIPSVRAVQTALLANFFVRHHIIWRDPTAGESWLAGKSFPRGPQVVVNTTHTDIWVFQKKDTWTSHHARYVELPVGELPFDLMDRRFFDLYVKNNVWEIAGLQSNEDGYPNAPLKVLEPLIRMWSRPGDTVLDFCPGMGQVGIAALRWHRKPLLLSKANAELELRLQGEVLRQGSFALMGVA